MKRKDDEAEMQRRREVRLASLTVIAEVLEQAGYTPAQQVTLLLGATSGDVSDVELVTALAVGGPR